MTGGTLCLIAAALAQTCYDILFPEPGPELVAEGVRHIIYSAAIPVVGSAGMSLWTAKYSAVLIGSDLQEGESGVFINGTRASPVPPRTQGTTFVLATVPPF